MKVSCIRFSIYVTHYVIVKKNSDLTLKNAIKPYIYEIYRVYLPF